VRGNHRDSLDATRENQRPTTWPGRPGPRPRPGCKLVMGARNIGMPAAVAGVKRRLIFKTPSRHHHHTACQAGLVKQCEANYLNNTQSKSHTPYPKHSCPSTPALSSQFAQAFRQPGPAIRACMGCEAGPQARNACDDPFAPTPPHTVPAAVEFYQNPTPTDGCAKTRCIDRMCCVVIVVIMS
jgi:hypothetical protein